VHYYLHVEAPPAMLTPAPENGTTVGE
jgi:hypothetical protein